MDDGWISGFQQRLICGTLRHFDRLPNHIGIVMDGNRRYARIHGQARKEGHASGFDTMSRLLAVAYSANIEIVTVYAFSIENFNRTQEEVNDLMDIAREHLGELIAHNGLCQQYGVRINVLGKLDMLSDDIKELANHIMDTTKHNSRAVLNLCMPYTARDDMASAIRHLASSKEDKSHSKITEESISKSMYTAESPKLDLLVRTSGTYRLSDFLLWETNEDTVIDFVPELWPEYTPWCLFMSIVRWRLRSPNNETHNSIEYRKQS